MNSLRTSSALLLIGTLACTTAANNPGGSPPLGGPMAHVLVTVSGGSFFTGFESPGLSPVTLTPGDTPYPAPADVLNGAAFNAQYGWLVTGAWGLPPSGSLWIRMIDQTEGLETYIGRPFGVYAQFDPCFGTGSSVDRIRWDGIMLHNYYATTTPGPHQATYELYFGDDSGNPLPATAPGYAAPATVTLIFEADLPCVGDTDGSGRVDTADLLTVLARFNETTPGGASEGDVDASGVVDTADLLLVLAAFNTAC